MEILQFCLLASDTVWRGRTPYLAINSNRFGKPWEFVNNHGTDENGQLITSIRKENGPSRKIFRSYVQELLKEKLITEIKTSDERSKYYSITPLGICQLIKSEFFHDGLKYGWPERYYLIITLLTFAFPNVKPYRSIIFENKRIITHDLDAWKDLAEMQDIDLRGMIIQNFSNIEFERRWIEFYLNIGKDENKIKLARIRFDEKIVIEELNNVYGGPLSCTPGYEPLVLDDEQFHHYFATLMICSLISGYAIFEFDSEKQHWNRSAYQSKQNRRKIKHEFDDEYIDKLRGYPKYFQDVTILFSKHISRIIQKEHELMTGLEKEVERVSNF